MKTVVVPSTNVTELIAAFDRTKDDILVLACKSEDVESQRLILSRYPMDIIFILDPERMDHSKQESWWRQTTIVHDENALMRNLCIENMLRLYDQGVQHRQQEKLGVANLLLTDSQDVLNHLAKFP